MCDNRKQFASCITGEPAFDLYVKVKVLPFHHEVWCIEPLEVVIKAFFFIIDVVAKLSESLADTGFLLATELTFLVVLPMLVVCPEHQSFNAASRASSAACSAT